MNDLSTLCQNFHHKMIDHNFKEIKFSSGRVQSMIMVIYLLFVKFYRDLCPELYFKKDLKFSILPIY